MTRPTDIVIPVAVYNDMQKIIEHHLSLQHNNETTMKDRAIQSPPDDSRGHLENLVKDKATVTVELPVQLAVNLIADELYGDDHQAAAQDIVGLVDSAMESQHGVDDDDVRDYWNASSGGQS